jgi:hypothetical protein
MATTGNKMAYLDNHQFDKTKFNRFNPEFLPPEDEEKANIAITLELLKAAGNPQYYIKRDFSVEIEHNLLPRNEGLAKYLISKAYDVTAIQYYHYCGFKDEDKTLFRKVLGGGLPLLMYLYAIDKDIQEKNISRIPAHYSNLGIFAHLYEETGIGFNKIKKIIDTRITTKKKDNFGNFVEDIAIAMYALQEYRNCLIKIVQYLEDTDFGNRNYVRDFILNRFKEYVIEDDQRTT